MFYGANKNFIQNKRENNYAYDPIKPLIHNKYKEITNLYYIRYIYVFFVWIWFHQKLSMNYDNITAAIFKISFISDKVI